MSWQDSADLPWTVVLGTNKWINCKMAVLMRGVELFQLRERTDDQLVADFEMRDQNDKLLVKVAKNNVVHVAPGRSFKVEHGPDFSRVVDEAGKLIALAQEVSLRTVRLQGSFWAGGCHLLVDETRMLVNGRSTMTNCTARDSQIGCLIM